MLTRIVDRAAAVLYLLSCVIVYGSYALMFCGAVLLGWTIYGIAEESGRFYRFNAGEIDGKLRQLANSGSDDMPVSELGKAGFIKVCALTQYVDVKNTAGAFSTQYELPPWAALEGTWTVAVEYADRVEMGRIDEVRTGASELSAIGYRCVPADGRVRVQRTKNGPMFSFVGK